MADQEFSKRGQSGGMGAEVPQWGSGAKSRQGVWGRSHPEAEANCEISVIFCVFLYQFLGFNE